MNPEAAELLFESGNKIGFIFNIGDKNIGKSFLLNEALNLDVWNRAFGENMEGIKFWTKPFYKEEDDLAIFFVDV